MSLLQIDGVTIAHIDDATAEILVRAAHQRPGMLNRSIEFTMPQIHSSVYRDPPHTSSPHFKERQTTCVSVEINLDFEYSQVFAVRL